MRAPVALFDRRIGHRRPKIGLQMAESHLPIYVGTSFGDDESPTGAVLRLSLSPDTGALATAGEPIRTAGINPGWITRFNGGFVYVGMEDEPGSLQAYKVCDDGNLEPVGSPVSSVGRNPCYCQLDASGKWLLAANYSEGSVCVAPVLPDGTLGPPTDSKHHQGGDLIDASLHDRQEGPHAHCIIAHPSNRWVVACDLGLSAVFVYGFDDRTGTFSGAADDPRHHRAAPDAGCRHCCWGASGTTLFIQNELACSITVTSFDEQTGVLTPQQTIPALPNDVKPNRAAHRGGSDLILHPNGKLLFAGCRSPSPGLIAIFAVDGAGASARLSLLGHESTRGEVPRNFKLLDGGRWLVVGNQESKNVVSFEVDADEGKLRFVSEISTAPYKPCNIAGPSALTA
jgi:6-phosphogluconolactonase